ncbi:hypothetical protein AUR64_13755 [Haloprofundus marisrubri]|uniref:Uncharacterized protein n=1 Tax=Haloprofundus marisrubri TaxID=1514971 RepID=A0A0W1R643_9EURY|nr:hypothetical protein [Haloprofundus marisrubri]KTG08874.1 hypothetical protein AUR64_13755 [Haloprofundus marisrubri]
MSEPPTSADTRPNWTRTFGVTAVVSIVYTAVVVGYSVLSSNVSISGPLWQSGGILTVFAFGSVGLPVALWYRYRYRSPVAFMSLMLLFWHVLVEFPPVGSGQGDSPGFTFVFVPAPLYVLVYLLLAGGESLLRKRGRERDGTDPTA